MVIHDADETVLLRISITSVIMGTYELEFDISPPHCPLYFRGAKIIVDFIMVKWYLNEAITLKGWYYAASP